MTDNEIIMALKKALTDVDAPIGEHWGCGFLTTKNIKDALDLINRLQADYDNLKNDELPRCKDALRRANEIGMELQAEIERLIKDSKRLKKVQMQLDDMMVMHHIIKAEAHKEFAERLCEGRVSNDPVVIATKCLLKEMVGESK